MATEMTGFPRGWFVVAWSEDLPVGGVRPLKYFGRDLVLFRTESGVPKMLDAFCPPLGAHLGHGGEVKGESIACPFHAWEFDGAGRCTAIPYANKIPKKARLNTWPVAERNGVIFVWHDRDGGAPTWEVPAIEGHGSEEWTAFGPGDAYHVPPGHLPRFSCGETVMMEFAQDDTYTNAAFVKAKSSSS